MASANQGLSSNRSLPVEVRVADARDLPVMIDMVNSAFAIETFLDGTRTDDERMSELMQKGEFLIAEKSGVPVACVYTEVHGERGYFGMLSVHPSQQGQGLGRYMVTAAENHCQKRGCRFMDITVLSPRTELPPFYRKLGYEQTGTKEFVTTRSMQPGLNPHLIVMSRKL